MKKTNYTNLIGRTLFVLCLFLGLFSCRQNAKPAWDKDAKASISEGARDVAPKPNSSSNQYQRKAPDYVYDVWAYVAERGKAKQGYVGGRSFMNREKRLPKHGANGQKLKYREWDVHRKIKGKNRGAERLVTGSDKSAYYTKDHYRSFIRLDQ